METASSSFLCSNVPWLYSEIRTARKKPKCICLRPDVMNDTASEMAYWILPAFLVSFYLSAGLAALAAALVANSETKSPKLPE
jgi:hypothetical protein